MAVIGALRVELAANIAKFEADLGKAAKRVGRLQRSFDKFGDRATRAGQTIAVGFTAPLAAIGAQATKSFLGFERGMNRVAAVSGATEAEMTGLTRIAKDLGATTSFSAAQAAEGLGFLAQAGFDAAEAGAALPGVLQLAAAGGIQLAEAADIATNVLSGYGMEVEQLARVNDVLAKASSSANTDVLQLGQAFKFAGPVASSAGVSFETAGAAMALMGNAGIQAEMAGTALRGAITKLLNPSTEAAATMAELGISATDSTGRLLPLDQIIEQLAPHADKTGAIMQIFGQRAGPAMSALVSQGADALREMTAALEESGGTAEEIAEKKLAGLTGAWTRLQSAVEGILIEIGERLAPVLERIAGVLTDTVLPAVRGALEAFDRLSPAAKQNRLIWLGVAAAIGPALIAFGGIARALSPLLPAFSRVWIAAGRMTTALFQPIVTARQLTTGMTTLRASLAGLSVSARAAAVGVRLTSVALTGLRFALRGVIAALGPLAIGFAAFEFVTWAAGALKLGDKLKRLVGITDDAADAADRMDQQWAEFSTTLDKTRAALNETAQQIDVLTREHERLTEQLERAQTQNRRSIPSITKRITALNEEIETVKRLHDERAKDVQFGEVMAPLAEMAAKDLQMWTAATREAKTAARELGVELSVAVTMDHLTRAVREFATTGALTPTVMREIGTQAADLGVALDELPPELRNIVTWLRRTDHAVSNAGDTIGDTGGDVETMSDGVKTLVGRLRGTGAIQSAQHWAAALDQVGGLTRLTTGETDELAGVLDAALEKYRALGQDAPVDLQRLVEQTAAARTAVSRFVDATARLKLARAAGSVQRHLADTLRAAQFQAPLPATAMAFPAQALLPTVTPRFTFDPDAFGTWRDRVQASFTGFGATIGQTFARALEGGGQWLGAVQSLGTQAGDRLGGLLSTRLTKTLESGTGFLASGLGKMLGKGLGMAIPVIGPVVGQLIGKLFSLGGPSQAELAGRDAWRSYADGLAREANAAQIQEALGAGWANVEDAHAWIVLRDAVTKAGGSAAEADALWQRYVAAIKQGPDAVNAVTAEMDAWREAAGDIAAEQDQLISSLHGLVDAGAAAFDPAQLDPYLAQMEQLGLLTAADAAALRQLADDAHVDHEAMRQAAERYGVELSALGPQFEQARLSDAAAALVRDFDLLTQEGANVNGVLAGMQDEVQALVAQALTAGVAIPAGMQPIIASLIEQERLTDQNGNKLTDMSHLDFADPIAAKFDLLADSIQLLIIALGGPSGLSKAIEDMVGSAELDLQDLAGAWAAMTDEAKAQFGDFASFVEDRALQDLASAAGLNFDDIAAAWAAMTAEQQAAFGDFRTFLQDHELRQMVDDAGLRFDELETRWAAMTDAQRDEIADFRAFVNHELAKIRDRTVTVTTRHRSEGTPSGVGGAVHAQHGTPFRQFGSGTRAVLHGLERVMTAGEGRGIQAALGSIQLGLGAIADLSGVRALASGGLVTRPTLTMLGERGPEAVIPQHEIAEFGGGRRVEAKLDQLHQDVALLLDEFRHGLDPRRMARAWHQAAAFSS